MTSPRATYGGGYYSAPSFPDTPIYDSLVAERGTPQIAPIRVPSAYDTGSSYTNSYLPALPAALPALPAAPSQSGPSYGNPSYGNPSYGYPQQMQQPMPLQHAPAPYIPQQTAVPRGYPGPQPQAQPQRPVATGYEAMRPAAARPAPAPAAYEDPYNRPYQSRGY
ncbi:MULTISPECIES: DUF6643 family protein [unclassified Streptomyces]|uniref:DUF6643 family protein n=1 Tax=unclassified Streptomyces TaxID=2593676 RepID=UPI002DD9983D|nr:DUF6643 family protein [Streptomyces sp. NBC_01750]WSB04370.1 hypothetical protein OIE54_36980 [Streptomyces sp. NBC_01794]WSD31349.1 hypothetical protein OG966_05125 [Streptomyces sp. NBC_01750]